MSNKNNYLDNCTFTNEKILNPITKNLNLTYNGNYDNVENQGHSHPIEKKNEFTTYILNYSYGFIISGIENLELNESNSIIIGYVREQKREDIRLGNYILIPYDIYNSTEYLFLKIVKIKYLQEFDLDDATEINAQRLITRNFENILIENDYKLLIYLEPICILYFNSSTQYNNFCLNDEEIIYLRRSVDKIPKPHSLILPIFNKNMLKTGLNIPNTGIFIGHLCVSGELIQTLSEPKTVGYYLKNNDINGEALIFRHLLICGSTGTGKTFFTKNLLRQFMDPNNTYKLRKSSNIEKMPCLIILDPQDEYSQLYEDNLSIKDEDIFFFSSEGIKHGGFKNTILFVPKINKLKYRGLSKTEQIEFTIPFSFVKSNPWILELAELTENQYIGLELIIEDFFKKYTDENDATYFKFKNFLKQEETRKLYVEYSKRIHESSYDGIVRKVINNIYDSVFDQDAASIISLIPTIFNSGQISIFPTEFINSPRIRDIIMLTIMTLLVNNKLNIEGLDKIKETPIILAIDEAHRYLSSSTNIQSYKIISKFSEAAKQGRKECLGLVLITQDPQDIHESILKQINTKIIFNIHNENALKSLQLPKEYEKRASFLKRGHAIVLSPDNGNIVEVTGLEVCTVKHI